LRLSDSDAEVAGLLHEDASSEMDGVLSACQELMHIVTRVLRAWPTQAARRTQRRPEWARIVSVWLITKQ
jgi:hypothetical protein